MHGQRNIKLCHLIIHIMTVTHLLLYCYILPLQYNIPHCIAQSSVPEDGQNCSPKHVKLIWIY